MTLEFLGLTGDPGSIIVASYMNDLAAGLTCCHKTSGKKLIPRILRQIISLSGKQGFIYFQISFQYLRICRYLFPGLEEDQIIHNQLLCGYLPFFSFTQNYSLGFCQDCQLVDGLLGSDLLNDSNYRINKNDSYKHGILVGTNQQHENQQHQVQKIEECKCILQNDLLISPGVGVFVIIYLALRNSLLNFFVRKSCHVSTYLSFQWLTVSIRAKLAHATAMILKI